MARITMRKVQETKLSEVFTLYLASAAARGVKDKPLRTYEQHFRAISKRLDVDGNISQITSKDLDKMILKMREDGAIYNPDVLSCLANLSNDEVFTPPEVVNQMLDALPEELFSNPDTTFLDPACKTGVFLREIAKRLIVGVWNVYAHGIVCIVHEIQSS